MSSLEKAQAFMKRKLVQTALVVVPLAIAAGNARATTIFSPSGDTFTTSGGSSTLTSGSFNSAALAILNDIQGVKLWGGIEQISTDVSGGVSSLTFTVNGGSGGADTFASGASIPLLWDFNLGFNSSSGGSGSYSLLLSLNSGGAGFFSTGGSFGISPGTSAVPISGSGSLSPTVGNTLNFWTLTLTINWDESNGDNLTLDIPSSSIDINGITSTPEPATAGLIGLGLSGLFLLKNRFRRRPE